ncbi:hypothetical protein EJ04DRAFT_570887 [Polyplosphaeria fusca]|uniref:Uncharacterized protein n=1 Tax=Polyplosphaeria fusca TaxID=682080 RepID=A0A9P4QL17_9PLEO|nr:hypothetical protein EJ04DRAFT_570887 [Polyplosphaeria fusca]
MRFIQLSLSLLATIATVASAPNTNTPPVPDLPSNSPDKNTTGPYGAWIPKTACGYYKPNVGDYPKLFNTDWLCTYMGTVSIGLFAIQNGCQCYFWTEPTCNPGDPVFDAWGPFSDEFNNRNIRWFNCWGTPVPEGKGE